MWPMLAGIGPILGEGTAGMFVTPDSVKTPWSYSDGTAWIAGNASVTVPWPSYYELISPDPFVGVITGPQTASSGEAILVSFLGRPNTRTFGLARPSRVSSTRGVFPIARITLMSTSFAWPARSGHLSKFLTHPPRSGNRSSIAQTPPMVIK